MGYLNYLTSPKQHLLGLLYLNLCVLFSFFPVEIIHSKLLKLHIITRHFMTLINEVLVTEYTRCIFGDRVHLLMINMHLENESHSYLS